MVVGGGGEKYKIWGVGGGGGGRSKRKLEKTVH